MHNQVLNADFGEIVRKPVISMRDPQQPGADTLADVARVELLSFGQSRHDAAAEVQAILANARETAETMIAQTRASLDGELELARRAGYEAGYTEGLEIADRDSASVIATAEHIASCVAHERTMLIEHSEGEIVDLALAIAQRIVNAAIDIKPELVIDVCRGAMRKAFQRETLVVLAHPDDLAMLRAAGPAMSQELGGIHQLDFIEERRLERGSVTVRTPVGEIDATFTGKAAKIEESLRELIDARRAESRTIRRAA